MVRPTWVCIRILGPALMAVLACAPALAEEVDKFLPNDSEAVLFLNVRQVLDSGLVQKVPLEEIKDLVKASKPLQELFAATEVDPFQDIRTVTLAGLPRLQGPGRWLAIVRGRFDLPRIQKAAADYARKNPTTWKIQKLDAALLYEGKPVPFFACFLDGETLILSSSRTYILEALAKQAGTKQPALNRNLRPLVEKAGTGQSLWGVGVTSVELRRELAANPQTRALAAGLENVTGGATVSDSLRADFRIQTTDTRPAQEVLRLFQNSKDYLILGALAYPRLAPLLAVLSNGVKLSSDKGTVVVQVEITASDFDGVIQKGLKP